MLSYDTDGNGNPEDYIVGLGLPDADAAVAQAREYLRSAGYPPPASRRRHDHRSRPVPCPAGHHGSGSQARQPLRRGTLIRTAQPAVPRLAVPPRRAFRIT